MTPLCFIDTETTGLHPGRRVWEVGMIVRRDDNGGTREDEMRLLIRPRDLDLANADPFALNVGRFYERHPHYYGPESEMDDVLSEADAADVIEDWTRGAHLVGAVPAFDAGCLDPMLRRNGHLPNWHHHLIDVEAMAVGWLAAKHAGLKATVGITPPWKSDVLSLACGIEPPTKDERRTALGDARWAMRWYDAMAGGPS